MAEAPTTLLGKAKFLTNWYDHELAEIVGISPPYGASDRRRAGASENLSRRPRKPPCWRPCRATATR
jgi:hypothetical protein